MPQSPEPKRGNGFGVTALVLGIATVVTSFIPIPGSVAFAFGPLAIIFGLLGILLRKGTPRGTSSSGIVLGGIGIIIAIIVMVIAAVVGSLSESVKSFESGISEWTQSPEPFGSSVAGSAASKVEFIATSTGGATVTYGNTGGTSKDEFTGDFEAEGVLKDIFDAATIMVIGDPLVSDQKVSCEIRIDGKTIETNTGTTAATCTTTKTL